MMTGWLAISMAGHDCNHVYAVLRAQDEYFWLADGKRRSISNPKKKKRKHTQVIKSFSGNQLVEELMSELVRKADLTDQDLQKLLKAYNAE